MFLLRIHKTSEGNVVAACDSDILGKRFEEGELILDVNEKFFGGRKVRLENVLKALKNMSTANIVGNNITNELLKEGLLDKDGIKEIKGVKHALIFKI